MRPSPTTDREKFPEIAEEIGEDPARFLDQDLLDDTTTLEKRIQGIDFLDVIDAWLRVEAALDRGPRDPVVRMLHERQEALEEHGERGDRGNLRPQRPRPEKPDWLHEGEPYTDRPTTPTSASIGTSTPAVATDGGQERDLDGE